MKIMRIIVISLLVVLCCQSLPAQKVKKMRVKDLTPRYRVWLAE